MFGVSHWLRLILKHVHKWETNIKMNPIEIGYEGVTLVEVIPYVNNYVRHCTLFELGLYLLEVEPEL